MSFVEKLMFSDLTFMLDKCLEATSTNNREKILKKFFTKVLELQQQYKSEFPNNDPSLYPLIRILLSNEEHERAYGIQEKTLRKILVNSLKIAGNDAKKVEQCNEDEIADTAYEIVKSRSSRDSKLTIQQVDTLLNNLCDNQKQQFQQNQFEFLFLNGSASDFKWIVKIVLKKMKLRITVNKLLLNYHRLAPQLYAKFNHLSNVCKIIDSGRAEEEVKDKVEPFIPIRPMLSQKFSNDMNNMIGTTEFYQEIKLDGERFQMHMENNVYKYFSRNAHDFSEGFNILLSPLIKFKTVVHSLILDGEMIIWNRSKQRFVTKGETELDVKKLKDPNNNLRPCYCAFDVLYVNGVSYIDQPFNRRCEILSSLFDDQIGIMIKTQPIRIRDVDHLVSLFNAAMQSEEEGIILKKSESKYMPGEREKGGWYKVKADYFDGELVKEFDCVIIGGTYQNPHKKDYLVKYLVGAVEKLEDGSFNVYSVGEVIHGLSRENRSKLNAKLVPFMRDYDNEKEIEFEKGQVFFNKSRSDVFIPPHKSIVLQIKASELATTSEYYTKFTFRFPRISEVRYDKFWDDSVTLKEFQEFFKSDNSNNDRRVRKINKRNAHKDDIVSPSKKRKLASSRSAIEIFCHDSQEDDIEPIDNVLEGKEFCVLTTSSSLPSVRDLKVLLRLHGASITEFPRKNKTFAIIAAEITQRIKVYMNVHNIIKADWIVENLTKDHRLDDFPDLRPRHFHYINDSMKESFSSRFDQFGDSYTEQFNSPEELTKFMMEMNDIEDLADGQLINFEDELYDENFKNRNFFRGFSGFFYEDKNHPNDLMKIAKTTLKLRAGHVSSTGNGQKYIFIDKSEFKKSDHEEFKKQKLIDFHYILNSNDAGKLLDIEDYVI